LLIRGGTPYALGTVAALETRELRVERKTITGFLELQLMAVPRNGVAQMTSERFSLLGARMVEWQLDVRQVYSVTIR